MNRLPDFRNSKCWISQNLIFWPLSLLHHWFVRYFTAKMTVLWPKFVTKSFACDNHTWWPTMQWSISYLALSRQYQLQFVISIFWIVNAIPWQTGSRNSSCICINVKLNLCKIYFMRGRRSSKDCILYIVYSHSGRLLWTNIFNICIQSVGAMWAAVGVVLGPSWGLLWPSWDRLGPFLGLLKGLLGTSWGFSGLCQSPLARI